MKPTYEDVYQTQHPNVQEYLKHVQQATLLSAIHVSLAADLSWVAYQACKQQVQLTSLHGFTVCCSLGNAGSSERCSLCF